MNTPCSPTLIGVLQTTLRQLEQTEEIKSDDAALLELKRSIALVMAELEVAKAAKRASADVPFLEAPVLDEA